MVKQPPHLPQPDDVGPIPDDLQTLFGRNLRAARIAHNLTHQELADKAGFKRQYVSRVEAGQLNLTLGTMTRLAAVLGQDVSVLLRLPDADDVNPSPPQPPG